MSFCKISVNGWKSAESKTVFESGTVAPMNRIRPDMLSNYMIKVQVTRVWCDFVEDFDESLQNSVLPDERLFRSDDNSRNTCERQLMRHQHAGGEKAHVQHIRKSFSAVRSGLFWTLILARMTLRSCGVNGCTSAYENLQKLMRGRDDGEEGVHGHHRYSSTHRQDPIERYCSVCVHHDFLRLQAIK